MTTGQQTSGESVWEGSKNLSEAVKVWQETVTQAANEMARNVEQLTSGLTSAESSAGMQQGLASTMIDSVFDFAEQLLTSQREFVNSVLTTGGDSWRVATQATPQAGRTTAQTTRPSAGIEEPARRRPPAS